jgi:hypothetical protein
MSLKVQSCFQLLDKQIFTSIHMSDWSGAWKYMLLWGNDKIGYSGPIWVRNGREGSFFFNITMNIDFYFYFNVARDVVTVLLIFANFHHFHYTFTHAHLYAHTRKHTSMISAQEEWWEPSRGAWLKGMEVGFERGKDLAHTHAHTLNQKFRAHQEFKSKKIRANRASSKATTLLLMQ